MRSVANPACLRQGGPNLRATQQYPAGFAEKMLAIFMGAPPVFVDPPSGHAGHAGHDALWADDAWDDADGHRLCNFLREAHRRAPWC